MVTENAWLVFPKDDRTVAQAVASNTSNDGGNVKITLKNEKMKNVPGNQKIQR